ncbi:MAG: MFS transporter [Alphaproteobacteria bacterium]|nr:MFS transporter [Alphaproteobacteria bacterium]
MTSIAIDDRTSQRNVLLLALSQALFMIGTSTMIAEASIVGYTLAADKAWATLPVALQQAFVVFTQIPSNLFMRRVGRRWGYTVGATFGIVGTALAAVGVLHASFFLFCLGSAVNGVYNGFGQSYRFAAVDGTSETWRGKAISYTLAGGVIAAVLGPELAKLTKDLLAPVTFAGSFAALSLVAVLALIVLQFIEIPRPSAEERRDSGRPLREILRQPAAKVAILSGMIGYGTMTLLMTVTPLAMIACSYPFESAAFVIQWHVLGMFAPSFFTGTLITRFGVTNVITCGLAILAACLVVNMSGTAVAQFWLGLFLLGIGWNFTYVGATTLLTQVYRPAEKAKVQAANDFLVFGMMATGALSSGAFFNTLGWNGLNMVAVPFIAAALAALVWLALKRRTVVA